MKNSKTASTSPQATRGAARGSAKGTSRETVKKRRGASQTEAAVDLIRMKIIDMSLEPGSKLDEPLLCDLVRGLGIDNPLALGLEFVASSKRVDAGPHAGCPQMFGLSFQPLRDRLAGVGAVKLRAGAVDRQVLRNYRALHGLFCGLLVVLRRRLGLLRTLKTSHCSHVEPSSSDCGRKKSAIARNDGILRHCRLIGLHIR